MPTEKAAKKLATNKVPRRKSHTDVSTWSIISFPILFVYRRFAKNTKYRKIKNCFIFTGKYGISLLVEVYHEDGYTSNKK